MKIQLSDHFSLGRLMRFTIPSIIMMVFTSVYGVVDGFFVSNLVGKTPFAAVNFIWPFLMILGAVGFMFGAGGGAALILECLERGLYPSWDAHTEISAALAEKLGYHVSHPYVVYEVEADKGPV